MISKCTRADDVVSNHMSMAYQPHFHRSLLGQERDDLKTWQLFPSQSKDGARSRKMSAEVQDLPSCRRSARRGNYGVREGKGEEADDFASCGEERPIIQCPVRVERGYRRRHSTNVTHEQGHTCHGQQPAQLCAHKRPGRRWVGSRL